VAMGQVYFRIISPVLHPHTCICYRLYTSSATDSVFKGPILKENSQLNWNSEQGVVIVFLSLTLLQTRDMKESILIWALLELRLTARKVAVLPLCPTGSMIFRVYVVHFPQSYRFMGQFTQKRARAHTHTYTHKQGFISVYKLNTVSDQVYKGCNCKQCVYMVQLKANVADQYFGPRYRNSSHNVAK
jgi:hypothetical protein